MAALNEKVNIESLVCYHCGAECPDDGIKKDDHSFCCEGCRLVYDLLKENDMCTYYTLENSPGIKSASTGTSAYDVLDNPEIRNKLIRFEEGDRSRVVLRVDAMHCASCIWLLEHLNKLNQGVISSEVNFPLRQVTIDFNPKLVQLSTIARLLAAIGYSPSLNLDDITGDKNKKSDNRILKIGIAGFCFGNIMMLSFPEYLGADSVSADEKLRQFFSFLSLALALPVLLYCGNTFFVSAWKSIRYKTLNIDAPIALAIAVTFLRSVYEITQGNPGYLDSMSGIIFFMLLGRYFQDRTYERMNFERDYKSYFPIAVTVKSGNEEKSVPITSLNVGDRIYIRNGELIPADAVVIEERSYIDYSFVTGESDIVKKKSGDKIYAGARQSGTAAEYEVLSPVSSGYLTQLWNNDIAGRQFRSNQKTYIDKINKYFSSAVIAAALLGAIFWLFVDPSKSMNAMTSVLIVACPCTLLLAATFTNGTVLRVLSKRGFYLKSAEGLEQFANADTIVFDKTGTITSDESSIQFEGNPLSDSDKHAVLLLARQSSHPLCRRIVAASRDLGSSGKITDVREVTGKGISGSVNGKQYLLGSAEFTGVPGSFATGSMVWVAIDKQVAGYFLVHNKYREGLGFLIHSLKKKFKIQLLSGDNDREKEKLEPVFGSEMYFGKTPVEKMKHIESLQSEGKKVVMIGDGLNDAGALLSANGGIVVSDNTNNYFPACDAILDAKSVNELPALLAFTSIARRIVYAAFILSVLYNFVGVTYSLMGNMSPVIAAILMPASTFSVILFSTIAVRIFSFVRLEKGA